MGGGGRGGSRGSAGLRRKIEVLIELLEGVRVYGVWTGAVDGWRQKHLR